MESQGQSWSLGQKDKDFQQNCESLHTAWEHERWEGSLVREHTPGSKGQWGPGPMRMAGRQRLWGPGSLCARPGGTGSREGPQLGFWHSRAWEQVVLGTSLGHVPISLCDPSQGPRTHESWTPTHKSPVRPDTTWPPFNK